MNLGNRSSAALADGRPDDSLAAAAAGVPYTGAGSYLLRLALLTAGYFAAGKLGLALAFINASASAVWPPAGIAVGALLALGWRIWPAVAVGSFLVNLTTSGLPLPYRFALPTANHVFLPGHRIMVQIQSSWFPLYDRNPQTFVPNIFWARPEEYRKASQRIYHTPGQASFIELPLVSGR